MSNRTKSFNVVLSPTEYHMLQSLADQKHFSKGLLVRELIRARYQMVFNASPQCANGMPCYVPHMHTATAPVAAAPTEE